MKKAVCLLSGGLDSTTTLYIALREGYEVTALTIHYGQLHEKEIESARVIASDLKIPQHMLSVPLPWGGSALLDSGIPIPVARDCFQMKAEIPATYVPARNSIFLSLAASLAEAQGAEAIFIGANALDYSGYPDCRPEYLRSFEEMLRRGTKAGIEGKMIRIEAPLIRLSKKVIIELAHALGVPFQKTWSCYQGWDIPCGQCDSCRLRAKGFREAGMEDPLIAYAVSSLR